MANFGPSASIRYAPDSPNHSHSGGGTGLSADALPAGSLRSADRPISPALVSEYFNEVRSRTSAANQAKVDQAEQWVTTFFEVNCSSPIDHAQMGRVLHALNWFNKAQTQNISGGALEVKTGDFAGLGLLAIDPRKGLESNGRRTVDISAIWGHLREMATRCTDYSLAAEARLTELYRINSSAAFQAWSRFRLNFHYADDTAFFTKVINAFFKDPEQSQLQDEKILAASLYHKFSQAAEEGLAEKLGIHIEAVPVPYSLIVSDRQRQAGVIPMDERRLIALNKALLSGGHGFVFCCPDYRRNLQPDGTYEYTMDGLGDGLGLTAERALPPLMEILKRAADQCSQATLKKPLNLHIGVADFEATVANATQVGLGGNTDLFEDKLNGSVASIARYIIEKATPNIHVSISGRGKVETFPIDTLVLELSHVENRQQIARLTIGRVTDSFSESLAPEDKYEGSFSFAQLVAKKREELSTLADTNPGVQKSLDLLLVLRLNLLLKWGQDDAPYYVRRLTQNCPYENKAEIVRDLQQGASIPPGQTVPVDQDKADALRYLRQRIAVQGAEYAVMHQLMSRVPSAYHIVADAQNMWQVFGVKSVPIMGIKGGYSGADVIDLSGGKQS